jgi:hypothetical protein
MGNSVELLDLFITEMTALVTAFRRKERLVAENKLMLVCNFWHPKSKRPILKCIKSDHFLGSGPINLD